MESITNKPQIVGFLILVLALFPGWNNVVAGDNSDMERFLNVKQWKGVLSVRVNAESHTSSEGQGKWDWVSSESHSGSLLTASGEISPGDPFLASDEQAVESESTDVEEGDMLEGIDMQSIQGQMRGAGMSEELIREAMQGMGQAGKLHVAIGQYKVWSLVPPAGGGDMDSALETLSSMGASEEDMQELLKLQGLMETTPSIGHSSMSGNISNRSEAQSQVVWNDPCLDWSRENSGGNYSGESIELMMSVNLHKKAYSFKWDMPYLFKLKQTFQSHHENPCGLESISEDQNGEVDWNSLAFQESASGESNREVHFEPLPDSGMVLAGEKTITTRLGPEKEVQVVFSWIFVPSDYELPEAWIEYQAGGDEWIPEDDNTVEATLEWSDNITPSQLRFTLYDISEEPGTSLNSENENTEPDLEFAEENKAEGFQIEKSGEGYIAVKKNVSGFRQSIVLHAKDFGAYGKLKAEIKVDGHWFEATSKEFELPYLPIPYDKNYNLIADQWEKDVGIYSKNLAPDWDEDPYPQDQKRNGDGFTLYEEYRGFQEIGHAFKKRDHEQVKDGHVRMDPMYKDVFIYDRDGLFSSYYKPTNPADLNWHMIDLVKMKLSGTPEENADYRWVNFNTSKEHFYRKQYALMLREGGSDRPQAGITTGLASCGYNPSEKSAPQPLKCNFKIVIYTGTIEQFIGNNPFPKDKGEVLQDILTTTVIHEIGHALGIIHHTHEKMPDYCEDMLSDDREGTACDANNYGVQDCAMRYEAGTEYRHANIIPLLKTRYCRKGETYITSEADESGNFKTFPSHNCYGQINVKGDP